MYQKTIKLFLQDGDPNERIICELSNWDGIAYKIPKAMLKESKGLKYISNTGVYLFFGEKEEIPYAYVGESENLYDRLIQHLNDDKDFWTECVAFTRKDNSLNKAHIKYIENILYKEAKKAARYEVDNGLTPTQSSLSEYEEAEMKEIIDNIKMLTNSLGYKVFSYTEKKKWIGTKVAAAAAVCILATSTIAYAGVKLYHLFLERQGTYSTAVGIKTDDNNRKIDLPEKIHDIDIAAVYSRRYGVDR